MAIAVEYSLYLVVYKLHCQFDKRLSLPRYAGSRTTHDPPKKAETDDSEQNGHYQRINVQHPEIALSHRRCHVRQMVGDIFRRGQFASFCHCYALDLYVTHEK